ncbi:hypothetical protein [Pelosinus propionicus]|uniref:Uncharacterized protein n=1 Tax=Pelosinus propionicus DSM 13327 TaxID=1123291 RepID=A0A1I4J370_9FIRM|nr:hypothetical protein [Pelosinus propionicus]SFL60526.1 hypothetical protein SAMN04490355_1010109 [Pelosinus propionicus DSM 13327]
MKENGIDMNPGRDLDIEVAVKVMGFIWLKHLLQFSAELAVKWLGTADEVEQSGGVYVPVVKESDMVSLKLRENFDENVPNYSTEMGAAQQIVEHMKNLGYTYNSEEKLEQEQKQYYGNFVKKGRDAAAPIGHSSEAEAIVKAALAALV